MTTRTLTGTYSAGYTLSAAYTALSITATGVVDGLAGTAGAYGGSTGGSGGVGVSVGFTAKVANNGVIVGGAGGAGGDAIHYGGVGGTGGAGMIFASGGSVTNTTTISGGVGGAGGGGAVTGGVGGAGGAGIVLLGSGTVTNTGSITGGQGGRGGLGAPDGVRGAGVVLAAGGSITNGGGTVNTALIGGYVGVYAGASGRATVTNFGTIRGRGGVAVEFNSHGDSLIVEAGSTFIGAAAGGGGALELAVGAGTITGLGGVGVLSGAVGLTFTGFGSYALDGGSWTLAGSTTLARSQDFSLAEGGSLAIQGAVANSGFINLVGVETLIEAADLTLSGSGRVSIGTGSQILGNGTLTNSGNTIIGTGLIGGGSLTLNNGALGQILGIGNSRHGEGLILDSGAATIANAGLIEADGRDTAVVVSSPIANIGVLEAMRGALTLNGAVTGAGMGKITQGGTLDAEAAFDENVTFAGSKEGLLVLRLSQSYTGSILGFSRSGGMRIDLRDIAFVGSGEATYSGTASGGVLTVTDGTHAAHIAFTGNYLGSTFTASSDNRGGTIIVAATTPLTIHSASPHRFIAAAASLGGGGAGSVSVLHDGGREHPPMLAKPGTTIA